MGEGYKLQVRVAGLWVTVAETTRYGASASGSLEAALFESMYQRLRDDERPVLDGPYGKYKGELLGRVVIVPKGGVADKAARKEANDRTAASLNRLFGNGRLAYLAEVTEE